MTGKNETPLHRSWLVKMRHHSTGHDW